jgi:hypothetical protein
MDLTTTNLLLTGILVLLAILTFVVIFVGFHFFRLIEEMRKTINTVDNDYNNLKNNFLGIFKNAFSIISLFKK